MNKKCAILIPVYKKEPDALELISLQQCIKVLKNYDFVFITHKKLDTSIYNDLCSQNNIAFYFEYFAAHYFYNVQGYNALMLSKEFYKRFLPYKFILIYQLDAWVFRDELEYWCNKSYDCIGAPWLEWDTHKLSLNIVGTGNGGFTLRKTEFFYKYANKTRITSLYHFLLSLYNTACERINIFSLLFKIITKIPRLFLVNPDNMKNIDADCNKEDVLWRDILKKYGALPDNKESCNFSFEHYPEYIYKLNSEKLPFGCHGINLYYTYVFLKKYAPDFFPHGDKEYDT